MQNYLPACKIVSTHGVRGEMKALPLCDGAQFLAKFKRLSAAANGSNSVKNSFIPCEVTSCRSMAAYVPAPDFAISASDFPVTDASSCRSSGSHFR